MSSSALLLGAVAVLHFFAPTEKVVPTLVSLFHLVGLSENQSSRCR